MKGEALKERPVGGSLLLSGHALTRVCVCVSTEAPGDFLTSGMNQAAFPCVSEFVFCDFKSGLLMFFSMWLMMQFCPFKNLV